jgi:hypothetical protein
MAIKKETKAGEWCEQIQQQHGERSDREGRHGGALAFLSRESSPGIVESDKQPIREIITPVATQIDCAHAFLAGLTLFPGFLGNASPWDK